MLQSISLLEFYLLWAVEVRPLTLIACILFSCFILPASASSNTTVAILAIMAMFCFQTYMDGTNFKAKLADSG